MPYLKLIIGCIDIILAMLFVGITAYSFVVGIQNLDYKTATVYAISFMGFIHLMIYKEDTF